jgi:hypothetical protein
MVDLEILRAVAQGTGETVTPVNGFPGLVVDVGAYHGLSTSFSVMLIREHTSARGAN